MHHKQTDFKFLTLNCCGIVNKMNYPEFVELIQNHDFICLTETKTDDLDSIIVPGYSFKSKNRKTNSRIKSGGIAFGYKSNFEKFIHPLDSNSKLVSWFKISGNLFNIKDDFIVGNIYIPPENSNYSIEDAIIELEREFLKFSVNYKYVLLNGDFNSRTSSDPDHFEQKNIDHEANFN